MSLSFLEIASPPIAAITGTTTDPVAIPRPAKRIPFLIHLENEGINDDDIAEIMNSVLYGHKDKYREEVKNLFSNTKELFNHLMLMCQRKNMNYDIVWDIMGDDIVDIIPIQCPTILIEDENGIEYLGHKYGLQEVCDVNI